MKTTRNTRRQPHRLSGTALFYAALALLVVALLVFSPGFAAGAAALWGLYVAFVVMLGLAYLAARGWQAYEEWRDARSPLAIVRRARGER